jgi:hypothetical protein
VQVVGDDKSKIVSFLKDVYRGGDKFIPLANFVENEKQENKDPIFDLTTIYKTVVDTMSRKGMIGNPEKVFDYIAGVGSQVRSIAEPTKGRSDMMKKNPAVLQVIALIKSGKLDAAKDALLQTSLPDDQKADIMMKIEKLKSGEVSEADVIRPLYQL